MAVEFPVSPRYDSRGLPDDFDPHNFYEYRRQTLVQTATGIESFAYKYIPWGIMKSLAFAIDPTAPFKVAPHRITPYNRTRQRAIDSVLLNRTRANRFRAQSHSQKPNFGGISVCWSPTLDEHIYAKSDSVSAITSQPPLRDIFEDTTSRTRLEGSLQGTARMFKQYLNSPSRYVFRRHRYDYNYVPAAGIPSASCSDVGGAGNTRSWSEDVHTTDITPSAAVFFPNDLTTLRNREYAYLESLISKHGLSMLKEWSPQKRDYTLFRNLVELRDLPRSVSSLRETLYNFSKLYSSLARSPSIRKIVFDLKGAAGQVPKEYLSYHFGWKQVYKDVMDLLALPEKMSKKYDFLIRRAGKPTTFRIKRNFTSQDDSSVPSFSYDSSPYEYGITTSSRIVRETELRLVINATFDFPPTNRVSFRSGAYLDRIGAVPRPTDIYNLIPWSWLLDWFTGLGNYIEVIDNNMRDESLINWGMITGYTAGKLVTTFSSKTDMAVTTTTDFVGSSTITSVKPNYHESQLVYECRIRKDAATMLAVNTTGAPNLTAYQNSILGALLLSRKNSFTSRGQGS